MEGAKKGEASRRLLAEKIMQVPIRPEHLAYCPTMDLLALATVDEQVHVFRKNGQRVFGVARKNSAAKVTDIKWKPDGQSLAVAFDHSVCIASAQTARIMYEKDHSAYPPISCLGWACNITDIASVWSNLSSFEDGLALDDFTTHARDTAPTQQLPNLPVELAFTDIASMLPKLSPLPIGGSR
ncbi:MAG: hypothetical protein Q9219_004929 [cf. Caloplaca sp. 3 TL-2023]